MKTITNLIKFIFAIPFIILAGLINIIFTLIIKLLPKHKRLISNSNDCNDYSSSIIIPSFNGKELLKTCIPSLVDAINHDKRNHEIIIIDNGSDDNTKDFLNENYPDVKVICIKERLGFGKACNLGIENSSKNYVVFLNNDMVVEKEFLSSLVKRFIDDKNIFAATSQIYFWDKLKAREETGKTSGEFVHGFLHVRHDLNIEGVKEYYPVLYAGGGSSMYSRVKLLELGGFDELYTPFYVEDSDLSYRAWKRGWKVIFEPKSIVYHKHRGTIGKFYSADYINTIIQRNNLLFIWRNISSIKYLSSHYIYLLPRLLRSALSDGIFINSFYRALPSITKVLFSKVKEEKCRIIGDNYIFKISSSMYDYRLHYKIENKKDGNDDKLSILMLCPYTPYPPSHGGAVRMYNVINKLKEKHNVYVLSFADSEEQKKKSYELLPNNVCGKFIVRKPEVLPQGIFEFKPHNVQEFYSPEMVDALKDIISQNNIDIVQIEYTQMAEYFKYKLFSKVFLTEHDVSFMSIYRLYRLQKSSSSKLKLLFSYMAMLVYEIEVCKKYDSVFSVTKEDKKLLDSFNYGINVSDKVPTGVDVDYYIPKTMFREHGNKILFIGYFRHTPNIYAIKWFYESIFPIIKKSIPDIELYIVGGGTNDDIKKMHDGKNIFVKGFVEDLREYYNSCDIFVCPITTGAGVRVKVLEAMSAGIPIVSTYVGSEGIDLENENDILMANDAENFANGVIQLVDNKAMRQEMSQNCRKQAEKAYSWTSIVENLEAEYKRALLK